MEKIYAPLPETKLFTEPNVSAASNNLESSIPLSPGRNPEIDLNILFSHFPSPSEYHSSQLVVIEGRKANHINL